MSAPWSPTPKDLRNLRGMIIDRYEAWRALPEWAPVIESAIRDGIESDRETFWNIYHFLWHGGLPGSCETRYFDEREMRRAWRRFLKKHYPTPVDTATA